ncbi:hypothetical protein MTF65_26610 [Streptomyces sp. APSN-46.1]|uniref:hypothetical protein n=1 Tax=Streptomyces sp. APSN-46.1 TaxID=2929049 RepID=UPI001FB5312A|nr:hypothetical protein [Streptomyces sp. APSN-46.1]MCJ1680854.1 hypothetical protein [Streptomyces sp. APSN-46.1]
MRLRTAAAALVGALAIVLPAAGPSSAGDHDGRVLGELHYRFVDERGNVRQARLHPADNDTCYRLTSTSSDDPAFAVVNDTESLAVLFEDASCGGDTERTLEPGEGVRNVEVASVLFRPAEHWGHHDRTVFRSLG